MKKTLIFALLIVIVYFLAIVARGKPKDKRDVGILTGIEIWEEIFVPELHKKFLKEVPVTQRFEEFIKSECGKLVLDHGGTRTMDPNVHAFITRLGKAFGLEEYESYNCPKRKVVVIDLQDDEKETFKWFSSFIDIKRFSKKVQQVILEDLENQKHEFSQQGLLLLGKLEKKGRLDIKEARVFVHEILYKYLKRHGKPLSEEVYRLVADESLQAANTLLLGCDFYHIAYDLNQLGIEDWYGIEVIEALTARLKQEGFQMSNEIEGKEGGDMRQTTTVPDLLVFDLEVNGEVKSLKKRVKFIEFVQRGVERDSMGNVIVDHKKIKRFRGVLRNNESQYTCSSV